MELETYSFSRDYRLLTAADFQQVFRESTRISDKYFVLYTRENGLNHARLGFAISKKQIKKSTDRNRLKRIVRESFRIELALLPNLDVIVTARHNAAQASRPDLWRSMKGHWDKTRRIYSDFVPVR